MFVFRDAQIIRFQAINQQLADTRMYRYYIDSAVSTGFLVDSSSANNQNPQLSRAVFSSLCSGNKFKYLPDGITVNPTFYASIIKLINGGGRDFFFFHPLDRG